MSENIQNTQPTNQTPIQGATKKCKHCQSDIPKKAKVCPICRKKQGGILKWIVIIFVALIIIGIIGSISDGNTKENNSSNPSSQASTPSKEVNGLTEEKYNAIETGMTYAEVVSIIGEDGINISESEFAGIKTVMYEWKSAESWGNANITFQDGKVINKAQFGVASGDDIEISMEQYNSIETGMTYDEVVALLGGEGTLLSDTEIAGSKAQIYTWKGTSLGANANVTFSDGKVTSKAQFGLK